MWDFGNTESHDNDVAYANVAALSNQTPMSCAVWFELNTLMSGTGQGIFGQHGGTNGWAIAQTSGELIRFFVDGGTNDSTTVMTVDSTPHSIVCVIASGGDIWIDGVDEGNIAITAPTADAGTIRVGDCRSAADGAPGKMVHAMAWNVDIGDGEVTKYHNDTANGPPKLGDLKFWTKCVGSAPQNAEIPSGGTGTKTGTVNEHVDTVDDYYVTKSGGFYWLIGLHWAGMMAASNLFGSALKMEPRQALLRGIRDAMGCDFYGHGYEHDMLIQHAGIGRTTYGYLGG